MAGRGPPPQPTALKLTRGNPGKRKLNDAEPSPTLEVPYCPDHLDDEARRHWNFITPKLFAANLLSHVDGIALAGYCQTWSRWVEAEAELKESGMFAEKSDGTRVVSPQLTAVQRILDQLHKYLVEFGMTPAARSRIRVPPKKAKDELSKFLKGAKRA